MPYTPLFSREYSVQYADCCMRMASAQTKSHTPMVIRSCVYIPENRNEVFCLEESDGDIVTVDAINGIVRKQES